MVKETKESEMAYKKPQIVAKSAARCSYVAGCPAKDATTGKYTKGGVTYSHNCAKCEISGRA